MAIFRFFKMAATAILHFHNVGILGSEGSRGSKCATMPNFVTIGQTVADIWRFSNFSKMAAVRHLGFVVHLIGPPTNSTLWSLSQCKVWLKSALQFRRYVSFNIIPVWLDNAYSCPLGMLLG